MTSQTARKTPKAPNPVDRTKIKGLPPKSNVQRHDDGKQYVYFNYGYRMDGKVKQERDYLGIVENNLFIPNDYYKYAHPIKEMRPIDRWKNPRKRAIEQAKLDAAKAATAGVPEPVSEVAAKYDTPPEGRIQVAIGGTAVLFMCLLEDGMVLDVAEALGFDLKMTVDSLNLGLHAAMTYDPTYLASLSKCAMKFLGWRGCPTSQRASELHQSLGAITDLPITLGKLRASHTNEGDLLALDSTRINCYSQKIIKAQTGKSKHGTFEQQVNMSMLFNATTGSPVCYRLYGGNTNDVKTMEDFRALWKVFALTRLPVWLTDRGYASIAEFIAMDKQNIRFLAGIKTTWNAVQDVISNGREELYYGPNAMMEDKAYGVTHEVTLRSGDEEGKFHVTVFRSVEQGYQQDRKMRCRLEAFESKWENDHSLLPDEAMAGFYKDSQPGQRPVRDVEAIRDHCYGQGHFAFISNHYTTPDDVLKAYKYRNEVEICFKTQLSMTPSTRVHSDATLNGLIFTTFIATSAISNLMYRMRRKDSEGEALINQSSVPKLLKQLSLVNLAYDPELGVRLIDNGKKTKEIIKRLGFEGLFGDANKIYKLFSVAELEKKIAERKSKRAQK